MKIIFATPSPFPYYSGGVETWMSNVIKRLSQEHEITVLAPSYHRMGLVFKDVPKNVKIVNYGCLMDIPFIRLFMRGPIRVFDLFYRQLTLQKKLNSMICDGEKVYVFSVDPIFVGPAVFKIRKKHSNLRFITSIRGPHLEIISKSFPLFKGIFKRNERLSVEKCDMVVVNGYDSKELYERKYNVKTNVLKNGVDCGKILKETTELATEIDESVNSVLSVATLIPIKGVFDLIDAAESYKKKYDSKFLIYFIGKGNAEKLLSYAKEKNVEDNVVLLGHRDNPIPYMKKTKINACVSGGGGFSMSMLEAMTSGKPVVAIDTPLYRQFNKYNNIPLVPEKSPEALADCFYQIFSHYAEYLEGTHLSQKMALEFDWPIVCHDLINYLESVE